MLNQQKNARGEKSKKREKISPKNSRIQVLKTGGEKSGREEQKALSTCEERSRKSARREVKIEARKLHFWATVFVAPLSARHRMLTAPPHLRMRQWATNCYPRQSC